MPSSERELRVIISGEIREKFDKVKEYLIKNEGFTSDSQVLRYCIAVVYKNLKLE